MSDAYKNGMKVRREVMGDEFVDRALANASEFSQPLQDFLPRTPGAASGAAPDSNLKRAV